MSSISSDLEIWLANRTSIYENSELKFFLKTKCSVEISNNWPDELLGTNVYKCIQDFWILLIVIVDNITAD